MTEGGVDYSFECVGLASLLNEAFISTRTVRLNRIIPNLSQLSISF